MALKPGEVYQCPDPECGCEVTVTKAPSPGKGGNQNPRCSMTCLVPSSWARRVFGP